MSRVFRPLSALLAAALSAPAAAQSYVETFTGGTNLGGWTYGASSGVVSSGGNSLLFADNLDTFAPQLKTTGSAGPFAGDWRARGVHSVGVDLITISTQFPFDRECTLMLSNGFGSVYCLGSDHVPQPGTGWKSFEFTFDPASTTLPVGWNVISGGAHETVWNAVITDVKTVTFFYGDPTFFFIFDTWSVGADNIRISTQPVWTDAGHALAGAAGVATLEGTGQLVADSEFTLTLENAAGSTATSLVVGLDEIDLPFKGGVLVPDVDALVVVATSPTGEFTLDGEWPAGVPSGTAIWLQAWWPDAGGPKGFAASNALEVTVP